MLKMSTGTTWGRFAENNPFFEYFPLHAGTAKLNLNWHSNKSSLDHANHLLFANTSKW